MIVPPLFIIWTSHQPCESSALFLRYIPPTPTLPTPPIHRHARCQPRALTRGVLRYGVPAGAQRFLSQALWWRLDSCLPTEYDTPVAEEDVRYQGERPTWPILLEPAIVPLGDGPPGLELVARELSIELQ